MLPLQNINYLNHRGKRLSFFTVKYPTSTKLFTAGFANAFETDGGNDISRYNYYLGIKWYDILKNGSHHSYNILLQPELFTTEIKEGNSQSYKQLRLLLTLSKSDGNTTFPTKKSSPVSYSYSLRNDVALTGPSHFENIAIGFKASKKYIGFKHSKAKLYLDGGLVIEYFHQLKQIAIAPSFSVRLNY